MTNEEKKAVLLEYRRLDARIDRAIAEQQRWRELATRVTPVYSDMPRGDGGGDKLLDAVQHIADLDAEINREIDRLVALRQRIEQSIAGVHDERLRDILRRRYIDGDRMEQIAVDLCLDYRWVRRLHARALAKLTLESPPQPVL